MRNWDPSPNDATAIAAFRWFANTIENEALELYATDRVYFEKLEHVLRNTLKEIYYIREKAFIPMEENGCPDGWVLCDGICKPSCDGLEAEASAGSAGMSAARTATAAGSKNKKKTTAPKGRRR